MHATRVCNERQVKIIFLNDLCITLKTGVALSMGLQLYTEIYMPACKRFQTVY